MRTEIWDLFIFLIWGERERERVEAEKERRKEKEKRQEKKRHWTNKDARTMFSPHDYD